MALLRGLRTFPCLGERSRRVLGLVLLVGYVTAVAVQMFDHAMWRDEAQAWLIARASPGLLELRQNLRFEGHPPLWHLVIWPVARLSANIELMKGVTFLLAAAFGALIALGRSFPPLLRPLLLAGFLPIFGYGVLSRPYILGLVLLFGWLELYAVELRCGRSTLKWRAVVALLLGLVQLMFTVVAGALLAGSSLMASVVTRECGGSAWHGASDRQWSCWHRPSCSYPTRQVQQSRMISAPRLLASDRSRSVSWSPQGRLWVSLLQWCCSL